MYAIRSYYDFIDTYFEELDPENPFADEEERFRQRHSSIITALISLIRDSEISNNTLVEIAHSISDNYITNIDEATWEELSKMAIACAQNEPAFLHLPSDAIIVEKDGYMSSLVYRITSYNVCYTKLLRLKNEFKRIKKSAL